MLEIVKFLYIYMCICIRYDFGPLALYGVHKIYMNIYETTHCFRFNSTIRHQAFHTIFTFIYISSQLDLANMLKLGDSC